jgi:hypothetical protein
MIAPGVVATAVVIGGIALWAWQRPAPRVIEVDVEPEPEPVATEPVATAAVPIAPVSDGAVLADPPVLVEAVTVETPAPRAPRPRIDSIGAPSPEPIPEPADVQAPIPLSPAPPPEALAPDSDLQEAIIAGDARTIIRLLGGGRAHGAAELRALFNAQRDTGDRAGACATVRQLVVLPDVPPAQRSMIQQYLDSQCQRAAVSAPPAPTPSESGSLSIVTVPWSRIFVDGVDTGRNTPVRDLRVAPGHHVIGFQTSDGTMHTTEVDVAPGEVVRLHQQL